MLNLNVPTAVYIILILLLFATLVAVSMLLHKWIMNNSVRAVSTDVRNFGAIAHSTQLAA
jgi:hypothetical protein